MVRKKRGHQFSGGIVVDSKYKKINDYELRSKPELVIGNVYYICYGSNIAYPGVLIDTEQHEHYLDVTLRMNGDKVRGGIRLKGGTFSDYSHIEVSVDHDEIGSTPEEAVRNTVK